MSQKLQADPNIHMENQETHKSQNNVEKDKIEVPHLLI
jgi:hypothetical protein